MKTVIVGKEDEELILKLQEENKWLFVSGDFMKVKDLYIMSGSESFNNNLPYLFKFDTQLTKLKGDVVEFIYGTNHNVIIFTEDEKLIPAKIKEVCEMKKQNFFEITNNNPVMKFMRKLGVDAKMEDVENIPIGQLIKYLNANWDKFDSKEEVFKLLLEINKRLYKVGDDWLYMYLIWGFPVQKRKSFFRFPISNKKGVKEGLIKKVADYHGMSCSEVGKSWWILRRVINSELADRYGLDNDECKLLGIKKVEKKKEKEVVEKVVKEEKKLKYGSLL